EDSTHSGDEAGEESPAAEQSEQEPAEDQPTEPSRPSRSTPSEIDFDFGEHERGSRRSQHDDDDDERLNIPEILPILPLKDAVIYPFSVQPFAVGQERYIRLIDDVMRGNRLVVLVAQKRPEVDHAGPDDLYRIGTVSRVGRMFRMPDGTVQIAVQ